MRRDLNCAATRSTHWRKTEGQSGDNCVAVNLIPTWIMAVTTRIDFATFVVAKVDQAIIVESGVTPTDAESWHIWLARMVNLLSLKAALSRI